MKTLKKVLCLVLALVMVVGTMAISAAAFDDDDEITNKDAAAVLNGIKVITGYENGEFDPDGKLTRDQGATIIYKLLQATDVKLNTKFADVKGTWSENAVAYCESEGIIAGYGDGKFGPADSLTAVQFAKMILVALGYDAEVEGFVGDNWDTNIVKAATAAGINVKAAAWSEPITRENAAQMAFNALTVKPVTYENGTNINLNGIGSITVDSKRIADVSRKTFAENFGLTLNDKGALKTSEDLDSLGNRVTVYATDDKTDDDIVVATAPDYETTVTAKTAKGVADGATKLSENINSILGITSARKALTYTNTSRMYVNGRIVPAYGAESNPSTAFLAGDEVKVYVDDELNIETVVVTRYEFGRITELRDLKNSEKNAIAAKIANETASAAEKAATKMVKINGVDMYDSLFDGIENFKKGSYVLYVPVYAANGSVIAVAASKAPETVSGTVSAIKSGKYNIGGTYYTSNNVELNIGDEGTWALNAEGKIVVAVTATAKSSNYAFVYQVNARDTANADGLAGGKAYTVYYVLPDGSKASAPLATYTDSDDNNVYVVGDENKVLGALGGDGHKAEVVAYVIDEDGAFTVAPASDALGKTSTNVGVHTDNGTTTTTSLVATDVYANNSTKFVIVSTANKKLTTKTYTGYKSVDLTGKTVSYIAKNGTALYVFAKDASGVTVDDVTNYTVAFVKDNSAVQTVENKVRYWTYTFVVDGEDVNVKSRVALTLDQGSVVKYKLTNGVVAKADDVTTNGITTNATLNYVGDNQLVLNNNTFNSSAKVYEITRNASNTLVIGDGELEAGQTVTYLTNASGAVSYVFITAPAPEN